MSKNTKETIINISAQFLLSALTTAVNTAVATAITHKVSRYFDESNNFNNKK